MNQPNLDHLLGHEENNYDDEDDEIDYSIQPSSLMLSSKYNDCSDSQKTNDQTQTSKSSNQNSQKKVNHPKGKQTGPAKNRFEKAQPQRLTKQNLASQNIKNHSKFVKPDVQQKTQMNQESCTALYRTKQKAEVGSVQNEQNVKYEKVKHHISKPTRPLVQPSYYEQHWTDERILKTNLEQGKIVEGRLFIDGTIKDKNYGFVMPDPIVYQENPEEQDEEKKIFKTLQLQPIKIWGVRNLNRAFHLDKVYVKFVDWIQWGTAGKKLLQNIDFDEFQKFKEFGKQQLLKQMKNQGENFNLKNFKIQRIHNKEVFNMKETVEEQKEETQAEIVVEKKKKEKKKKDGKSWKRWIGNNGPVKIDGEEEDESESESSEEVKDDQENEKEDEENEDKENEDKKEDDQDEEEEGEEEEYDEEEDEEEEPDDYYEYDYYGEDEDSADEEQDTKASSKNDKQDANQSYDDEYFDEVQTNIQKIKKAGVQIAKKIEPPKDVKKTKKKETSVQKKKKNVKLSKQKKVVKKASKKTEKEDIKEQEEENKEIENEEEDEDEYGEEEGEEEYDEEYDQEDEEQDYDADQDYDDYYDDEEEGEEEGEEEIEEEQEEEVEENQIQVKKEKKKKVKEEDKEETLQKEKAIEKTSSVVNETKNEQKQDVKADEEKQKPVFFIPTITKPPIFKTINQLVKFFQQPQIADLRPLGKIVGFAKKNLFQKVNEKSEEEKKELGPQFEPSQQPLKQMVHTGIMKRIRVSKEKSEYKQIIIVQPEYQEQIESLKKIGEKKLSKDDQVKLRFLQRLSNEIKNFRSDYFGDNLPQKFLITDKNIKELNEVRVLFQIQGTWKEAQPIAKLVSKF